MRQFHKTGVVLDDVGWRWRGWVKFDSTCLTALHCICQHVSVETAPPMACLALLNIAPSMKWTAMDTDLRAISCSKHPKGICDTICKHSGICIVRMDSAWFWWDLNKTKMCWLALRVGSSCAAASVNQPLCFNCCWQIPWIKVNKTCYCVRLSMTNRGMQIQNHFLSAVRKNLEVSKLK